MGRKPPVYMYRTILAYCYNITLLLCDCPNVLKPLNETCHGYKTTRVALYERVPPVCDGDCRGRRYVGNGAVTMA